MRAGSNGVLGQLLQAPLPVRELPPKRGRQRGGLLHGAAQRGRHAGSCAAGRAQVLRQAPANVACTCAPVKTPVSAIRQAPLGYVACA